VDFVIPRRAGDGIGHIGQCGRILMREKNVGREALRGLTTLALARFAPDSQK
jgi:hypothetical protein